MAPEENYSAAGPIICNDGGGNYFWYNWQPFSTPHPHEMFPPSTPVDAACLATGAAINTHRSTSSGSANPWWIPYAAADCPPHHHGAGASSPHTSFFPNAIVEWHPFAFCGEGDGDGSADVPQLEDFLGGHRASPPPSGDVAMDAQVSALVAAGHCYLDDERGVGDVAAGGGVGASSGNSSSDVDSGSSNGYHLALSGHSVPDDTPEIGLTCAVAAAPLAVVIPPARGGAAGEGKSLARVAMGSGQRTSSHRGVTRHRWTGRYEAHLWDNTYVREGIKRKGRQVYLGGYDKEEKAAIAYDLAALKYWGPTAATNFPASNYVQEIEEMKEMSRQEFIASLRRKSTGFSRGASVYRGVTRHHQHGRWQARIGRVAGNKDLYLGTFTTEEEAAEAYDIAAIKFRGVNAVTNFALSRYDIEAIVNTDLPIGSPAKRLKHSPKADDLGQHAMIVADTQPELSTAASFFHDLLQIRSLSGQPGSSPYGRSSMGEAVGPDVQNFWWVTADGKHGEHVNISQPSIGSNARTLPYISQPQ